MTTKTVTLLKGDGIGPEVVNSAVELIEETGVKLNWEECEAGEKVFKAGLSSGVPQETIDSIAKNKVALKGPLTTPVGYGEKSANVTLRKIFETYGNIRPVRELPGVPTPFQGRGVDLVVIRENVEDLYAGIEYMQTPGVAQCLKIISRKGCEKIARLAFEYARFEGRKRVDCATKANIMKLSEGLLKRTFEDIAPQYPEIHAEHIIIDNCAHQMAKTPESFDVIVTTNMNGDIISDLGSALVGGLGFAPSSNIGSNVAMFEAVHGSAPKYAGKNVINPTALILSAIMMLRHIEEFEAANTMEQALLVTLQDGKTLTQDIVGKDAAVTTTEFTNAIKRNFGKTTDFWAKRDYKPLQMPQVASTVDYVSTKTRTDVGVDLFIESPLRASELGKSLEELTQGSKYKLKLISNRGVKVYPALSVEPDLVDHYQCRFIPVNDGDPYESDGFCDLLKRIENKHRWMHIEKLQTFDDQEGFSRAQGDD